MRKISLGICFLYYASLFSIKNQNNICSQVSTDTSLQMAIERLNLTQSRSATGNKRPQTPFDFGSPMQPRKGNHMASCTSSPKDINGIMPMSIGTPPSHLTTPPTSGYQTAITSPRTSSPDLSDYDTDENPFNQTSSEDEDEPLFILEMSSTSPNENLELQAAHRDPAIVRKLSLMRDQFLNHQLMKKIVTNNENPPTPSEMSFERKFYLIKQQLLYYNSIRKLITNHQKFLEPVAHLLKTEKAQKYFFRITAGKASSANWKMFMELFNKRNILWAVEESVMLDPLTREIITVTLNMRTDELITTTKVFPSTKAMPEDLESQTMDSQNLLLDLRRIKQVASLNEQILYYHAFKNQFPKASTKIFRSKSYKELREEFFYQSVKGLSPQNREILDTLLHELFAAWGKKEPEFLSIKTVLHELTVKRAIRCNTDPFLQNETDRKARLAEDAVFNFLLEHEECECLSPTSRQCAKKFNF